MSDKPSRWLGVKDLVCDAVDATTKLVESTQNSVGETVVRYLSKVEPLRTPAHLVNEARRLGVALAAGSVRGVNQAVRSSVSAGARRIPAAAAPVAMRWDRPKDPHFMADTLLGVVNGLVGDHVRAHDNDLDLGMVLRFEDRYFAPENAADVLADQGTDRVAVFVHGLASTEVAWAINGEQAWGSPEKNFGTQLQADLGYTPLFLRYNSGLHVSDNGQAFAQVLSTLVEHYPRPIRSLALIGHSMGGLIARSATHYAHQRTPTGDASAWLDRLHHIITLGTPHYGSPLAQAGHLLTVGLGSVDTAATQVIAAVGRQRSAAIKDLRSGYLVQEDWHGHDPDAWVSAPRSDVAFVDGVTYVFIGSTVTSDAGDPVGRWVGDLLVHLPSATHAPAETQRASFPIERYEVGGLNHLNLQNHPRVYEQVVRHLRGASLETS